MMANFRRSSLGHQFAFMQHEYPGTAFGFIEVGGADQDGQLLVVNHLLNDFPQLPA